MRPIDADKIVYPRMTDVAGEEQDGITLKSLIDKMPTITLEPCNVCKWEHEYKWEQCTGCPAEARE